MQDAREIADASTHSLGPPARESASLPTHPAPPAPLFPTPTNLALALVMLGAVLSVWGYRRIVSAATRRAGPEPVDHASTPAQAEQVRTLIEGATRELADRAEHLESLVSRAERAAERLERLHAAERADAIAPRHATPLPMPRAPRPAPGDASLFDASRPHAPSGAIDTRHLAPAMIEHRPRDERSAPPSTHHPGRPDDASDPLHREIARLSSAGLSSVEIAQKLEQPVGQVELVLALRGVQV